MKTVTLCGSMRFAREMQANAIVQAHYRKIELSDGIYVVDIGGYIGQSAKQEIAYAQSLGKEVLYHSHH